MHARKHNADTLNANDGILDDVIFVEGRQVKPKSSRRKVHTLARAWAHIRRLTHANDDAAQRNRD